jgi:glucose/arabinose dehydrogenase
MKILRLVVLALVFSFSLGSALAQHVSVVTPEEPVKLVKSQLRIPAQFQNPLSFTPEVWLPEGFRATLFSPKLDSGGWGLWPRFMAMDSAGVVYLADHTGVIWALPDDDHDGASDRQRAVTARFDSVHSVAFYKGSMYVSTPTRIIKCDDVDGDGVFERTSNFITDFPAPMWINHHAKTLCFDEVKHKLYVGIGSLCDACRDPRSDQGTIVEFNDDGTGKRIYATGMRSTLGLAIDPRTRDLWATCAGSNQMGDQVPEELVTRIKEGGFYGYPYAFGNREFIPFEKTAEYQTMLPMTSADSARVRTMELPEFWLPSHATPAQIHFYRGSSFPKEYSGSGFVCVKGSWAARPARGYKVMRFWQDNGAWKIGDFFSGFMLDTAEYQYWARPVGAVEDREGNMYFSFEGLLSSVIRVSYVGSEGISDVARSKPSIAIYPQPVQREVTLRVGGFAQSTSDRYTIDLMDISGKNVMSIASASAVQLDQMLDFKLDLSQVPSGRYICTITSATERISAPVVVTR